MPDKIEKLSGRIFSMKQFSFGFAYAYGYYFYFTAGK